MTCLLCFFFSMMLFVLTHFWGLQRTGGFIKRFLFFFFTAAPWKTSDMYLKQCLTGPCQKNNFLLWIEHTIKKPLKLLKFFYSYWKPPNIHTAVWFPPTPAVQWDPQQLCFPSAKQNANAAVSLLLTGMERGNIFLHNSRVCQFILVRGRKPSRGSDWERTKAGECTKICSNQLEWNILQRNGNKWRWRPRGLWA